MNEDKDSRIARWSRRKLAARHGAAHETEEMPGETAAEVSADGSLPAHELPEETSETTEPTEPLPRIEDLTADSDLTAFLRKGVPLALKSAALRKMWSIDPNIRDYVGPAEYAWDFNQPGSMAGFGPLDPKKSVVGFLSRTVRALGEDAEQAPPVRAVDTPSDEAADIEADAQAMAEAQPVVPPTPRAPAQPPDHSADAAPETPAAAPENELQQESEPAPRPRHGGAMPR